MKKKVDLGAVLEDLEKATQQMLTENRTKLFAEVAAQMVEKMDFADVKIMVPEKYSKIIIQYHVGRQEYRQALDFARIAGIKEGLKEIREKADAPIPGSRWNGCY